MSIIRIPREASSAKHKVTVVGDGDADFDAELVFFVDFALGDTFNFRCMETVEFVFVMRLLRQNALGFLQAFFECLAHFNGLFRRLAFDVSIHMADQGF